MKSFVSIALIALMLLPMISANMVVIYGKRGIEVKNFITNLNDFPDYTFVSTSEQGYLAYRSGLGEPMKTSRDIGLPVDMIRDSGLIPSSSFFDVYAIHEDDFDEDFFKKVMHYDNMYIEYWVNESKMEEYLDSVGIKVIESRESYGGRVPFLSIKKGVENYFNVNLNMVKYSPDRVVKITNDLGYLYLIAPLISLGIIIYLVRRKKNG
jgi:hypothetical protein